jgi:hypothetical protein
VTIKSDALSRTARRFVPIAAFGVVLGLGGCASGPQFEEEGSNDRSLEQNAVKSIMTSLGAIDPHEKPIDYKPRATLVVPPKRDLPSPQSGTVSGAFPRNPEDVAEERRQEAMKNEKDPSKAWTPDELAKYRIKGAGQAEGRPVNDREVGRPLTPDEMRGQSVATAEAIKRAENPGQRQTLIEPPVEYRKPSANAPVELPPEQKSSWWPF